ncbi:hypothetical protein A9Q91_03135 [Candidatus Gracilibacteria bacterium 28_42_T64]|nr:hypothetical protein A9Q91_03135 [Candidatus Gracilibacteria bacterium 28_42_T64]
MSYFGIFFKKTLLVSIIILLSFGVSNGYSESDFEAKKSQYKLIIEKKFSKALSKLSKTQRETLKSKITKLIEKVEGSSKISDKRKLIQISLLSALDESLDIKISQGKYTQKIIQNIAKKKGTKVDSSIYLEILKNHSLVKAGTEIETLLKKFNSLNKGIKPVFKDNKLFIDFKFPSELKSDFDTTYSTYINELGKEIEVLQKAGEKHNKQECIDKAIKYKDSLVNLKTLANKFYAIDVSDSDGRFTAGTHVGVSSIGLGLIGVKLLADELDCRFNIKIIQ